MVILQREQVAQLSEAHTHTHKCVQGKTERKRHLMKDGKQLLYLGGLWVLVGQLWAGRCPHCVFCMCKWTKQKLIEESLGSPSCWKGMPPSLLWLSASVLISHQRGW